MKIVNVSETNHLLLLYNHGNGQRNHGYVYMLTIRQFPILVDTHSKWMKVKAVTNATSTVTIDQMSSIFATHGLPEMLVTDKSFTKQNGIRHVTSAPYHPASNGLAERAVQTFKKFMKKSTNGSIETRVSRFLLQYQITPQTTTGISPAEMLMGRRPRLTDTRHG